MDDGIVIVAGDASSPANTEASVRQITERILRGTDTQATNQTFLCGVRNSWDGAFTYSAGGWPFVQVVLEANALRIRPAILPLIGLGTLGVLLGLVLSQPMLYTLAPAAAVAFAVLPRRDYHLQALCVRRCTIGLPSRGFELATDVGTKRVWIWFVPTSAFTEALQRRGVLIEDS